MELFNQYFIDIIKKHYVDFDGRARRKEFWMFTLFSTIISIVLGWVDSLIFGQQILYYLYSALVLLPVISLWVRRLHDTNKSGWWLLLAFTGIGFIVLLVFAILEGEKGPNQYGPDPKGVLEN
ncbi:DUF805 domain-containing protein [Myroides injenensis]|uniref:DUF805 domain-containing protein n=1 Tax=Myroides injenensis TaxID=1183151 RepID=UPI00028A2D27|nr:DUF805 domain-containing protein [Myroides injenensis]